MASIRESVRAYEARLRKALLEYCRQDTLGLVRLLEKMRGI